MRGRRELSFLLSPISGGRLPGTPGSGPEEEGLWPKAELRCCGRNPGGVWA